MRFLGGKERKEFEDMAGKDEYIGEAYNELKKLSMDEQKRMEYELRQKAARDRDRQETRRRRGKARGIERTCREKARERHECRADRGII